jgi:hypothetical protein
MAAAEDIRNMVSHRVTLTYDGGTKVVGYLASCGPAEGLVRYAVLARAEILGPDNKVLARYAELPLVPAQLAGLAVTEGPL